MQERHTGSISLNAHRSAAGHKPVARAKQQFDGPEFALAECLLLLILTHCSADLRQFAQVTVCLGTWEAALGLLDLQGPQQHGGVLSNVVDGVKEITRRPP